MDGFPVAGTSSLMSGDPIITYTPMNDTELHRRVRNNAILAKIQELEANASVQAARSERLRMMRDEYESLVRKYASNRKWNWRLTLNSNMNANGNDENVVYPTTTTSTSFQNPPEKTHFLDSHVHGIAPVARRSVSTTGVNTDITGPVRPAPFEMAHVNANGFQDCDISINLAKENAKVITTLESHAEQASVLIPHHKKAEVVLHEEQPPASSSSLSVFRDWEQPNQTAIGVEKDEREFSVQDAKKNLAVKMEMMMLDEDDEDESLLGIVSSQRKQQLRKFHQLQHPKVKASHNDSISISSTSTPLGENGTTTTNTSNTTASVLKGRPGQKLKDKLEKRQKQPKVGDYNDETSLDTTVSLAPARQNNDRVSKQEKRDSKNTPYDLTDISLSDSTSVLQKHQRQRKLLLQQLVTSKGSNLKDKRKSETSPEDQLERINDGSKEENGGRTQRRESRKQEDDDDLLCSSPTTAGATSESIEDSLMDSIQKTPDTLPRDDSELQGIAEVNDEDDEQEEIELDYNDKLSKRTYAAAGDHQDADSVVAATAGVGSKNKRILSHSSVNDKLSDETGMSLKTAEHKIKELELHEQINDAEEIRSNNLSSSKLELPAEEEDFAHANNPVETTTATQGSPPAVLQQSECSNGENEAKYFERFHEEVGQPMEREGMSADVELLVTPFQERHIIVTNDDSSRKVNESKKEESTISHSHAPSANMSTHSSTTSSVSSGSSNPLNGEPTAPQFPADQRHSYPAQRQSSTGSSSTSSSRQHSLDEPDATTTTRKGQNGSKQDSSSQGKLFSSNARQHQSPTLPEGVHKRHHQLEEQVKKERKAKEATLVGADIVPERLSPVSSSENNSRAAATTTTAQPTSAGDNGSIKEAGDREKARTPQKTTSRSSPQPFSSSPAMKRIGEKVVESLSRNQSSTNSNATATGVSSRHPKPVKSPVALKQGVSTPTGPTGAQNTARRVRLKLNYDDSESDSSEIAPMKAVPVSLGNISGNLTGENQSAKVNTPGSTDTVKSDGNSKKEEDDDFDDFFGI